MKPNPAARPGFVAAFREIAQRIADSLTDAAEDTLPVRMFVAGGAAVHLYTGDRISLDIDASFSHRLLLPVDLEVSYRAADGAAQLLYFDRQHNDAFALIHPQAREDSVALTLEGIDPGTLDIRLLAALDLAVSKINRLAEHDREDLVSLTRHRLIGAGELRRRAEEAARSYVGNARAKQVSIDLACRIVADAEARRQQR